jgi:hypothetical protein
MTSTEAPRPPSRPVRLAAQLTVGLAVAFGLSTVIDLGPIGSPLLALAALGAVTTGWLAWDETRGAGHAVSNLRDRWRSALPLANDGDTLILDPADGGPPRLIRLAALADGTPCVAVLSAAPPATEGFRLWPRDLPRPGFDGQEPSVGGPALSPLPGVAAILGDLLAADGAPPTARLEVEGNAPDALLARLRKAPRAALIGALRETPDAFRGLTFDGATLATHWLGPLVQDPARLMAAATPILDALVPRPTSRPAVLN